MFLFSNTNLIIPEKDETFRTFINVWSKPHLSEIKKYLNIINGI